MIILKAEKINKTYKNKSNEFTQVLKGLDLEVLKGDFISIRGASGSGKSTLLHIIGGLDKPDTGNVSISQKDGMLELYSVDDKKLSNFRNKYFGFVFQFHHLLPEFTALENAAMPALIAQISKKEAFDKATNLLVKVGLESKLASKPANLSGGEQQRVAIVRALINNPEIILADEPTGNLDYDNSMQFLNLVESLISEYGTTFVIATHSNEIAERASRRFNIINGVLQ
jgi:ABC-type lipoprotein export system ATPase subunit